MIANTKESLASNSEANQVSIHLNQLVADSYGLMAELHLAHWNIEGSDFFQLHEAFQQQYEELFTAIDDIAERVRALDHYAVGGLKSLASMSNIEESPSATSCKAKAYVNTLLSGHETVIVGAIKAREVAAKCGDAESEDLLISRIQVHQKAAWFLRSYLR